MIEKMKYINLMGRISDLDAVIENYIAKSEIQLEYTSKELVNEKDLLPFTYTNPYTETLKTAENLFGMTGLNEPSQTMDKGDALNYIAVAEEQLKILSGDLRVLQDKKAAYKELLEKLEPFSELQYNIKTMSGFEYIYYCFGKMPVASFKQFETYIYHEPEIIFVFGKNDGNYIWGAYFVCDYLKEKYEPVFSSLHFEKIDFPKSIDDDLFDDSPKNIYAKYRQLLNEIELKIKNTESRMMNLADSSSENAVDKRKIAAAYSKIKSLYHNYEVRKYAARTKNDYFILVGWMTERESKRFGKIVRDDTDIIFIIEDDNEAILSEAPTKLRNPFFIKPFEFFIRMYGLPSYDEIEPTAFVALSYTILFGLMFGDIGQGAVISLLGVYLSKVKKLALGSVMTIIGLSSVAFGILFGSVFGIDVHALLMHPGEPANINTLLIGAICIGIFVILTTMVLNIANQIKKGRLIEVLFEPNGFAGIVFYSTILITALTILLYNHNIKWYSIAIIVTALLLIGLRHTLVDLIRGKKSKDRQSIGMMLFETFIEMFEVVIGYFTNTVSFVRVGAFALSHASLMGVVRMLAGEKSGSLNIFVMIAGNLLVLGLEGLIVGIQVLRIQFYEVFSRFYDGKGREFMPFSKHG